MPLPWQNPSGERLHLLLTDRHLWLACLARMLGRNGSFDLQTTCTRQAFQRVECGCRMPGLDFYLLTTICIFEFCEITFR